MRREILPDGIEVNPILMAEAYAAQAAGVRGSQIFTANCMDGSQWHFHVEHGLNIAKRYTTLQTLSLRECGLTPERVLKQYVELDTTYAMTTDLNKPLLFVPRPDKPAEYICIDGWHRTWKALAMGVDILYAYFLEPDHADAICIMHIPAGVERISI